MREIVKVVHAYEVEAMTTDGWTLTEVLGNASEPSHERVVTRQAYNDAQTGRWNPEETSNQLVVVTRPLFVLRKDADVMSREVALEKEVNRLQGQLEDAKHAVDKAKEQETLAKKAAEAATQQVEAARVAVAAAKKDLETQKTINNDHDKLLNLIRREIGDAKWREIEGSHTSCVHCIARQT